MSKQDKLLLLLSFIEQHKNLAIQGSAEWHTTRQLVIGGSEIATLIGKNRFSTIQSLICQKIGVIKFDGNAATRWGSLFEENTENVFNVLFIPDEKIYSLGSVPHSKIVNHRYSPDGLCVMKINNEYKIVLLEIKSPLNSIPEKSVPSYYMPQVKAGLCTLTPTDHGVFINNMYRKCALNKLNTSLDYDKCFHNDTKKKLNLDYVLSYGIILFSIENLDDFYTYFNKINEDDYDSDELEYNDTEEKKQFLSNYTDSESDDDEEEFVIKNILDKIKHQIEKKGDLIDLGTASHKEFTDFLELVKPPNDKSFIKVQYIKPTIIKDAILNSSNIFISPEISPDLTQLKKYNYLKTIENFKRKCYKNGASPIAVLPWKLLKSSIIAVNKEPDYLDTHADKINETINIIKNIISKTEIEEERMELFAELYPDSDIVRDYYLISKNKHQFL